MRYSSLAQAAIIAAVAAPALAHPAEIRSFEPEDAALIERGFLTNVVERADYDNLVVVTRDDQNQDPSPAVPTPHPWTEEDPSPAVATPRPWDSALDELN